MRCSDSFQCPAMAILKKSLACVIRVSWTMNCFVPSPLPTMTRMCDDSTKLIATVRMCCAPRCARAHSYVSSRGTRRSPPVIAVSMSCGVELLERRSGGSCDCSTHLAALMLHLHFTAGICSHCVECGQSRVEEGKRDDWKGVATKSTVHRPSPSPVMSVISAQFPELK